MKKAIIIGSLLAGSAVILGALNAHTFKKIFDASTLQSFDTGVRYQMYHALAILIFGAFGAFLSNKTTQRIIYLFTLGTFLFSGSIYALCALKSNGIIGLKGLGALTPIGGLILISAWVYAILASLRK